MPEPTLYDQVGGLSYFEALVQRFYGGVASDPVLRPLYSEQEDFCGPRRRLALFLVQYWGGPTTYLQERGHPRLRARHYLFSIGSQERDRWLLHMQAAIDESDAPAAAKEQLRAYMVKAADAMRNRDEADASAVG
jgi:hemoglobin